MADENLTPTNSTTEGQDNGGTPFKTFATEEEYNTALKSERSKGKGELLKELGVDKLETAKTAITKVQELETQLNTTKSEFQKAQEELVLLQVGVKEEFKNEALTLAKAQVKDGVDLKAALTTVITKLPSMAVPTGLKGNLGGESNSNQTKSEQDGINAELSKKYGIKFDIKK